MPVAQNVGKLRAVLDYMPCVTCLDQFTPEQDYFCAVCARLTREVTIRRTALGPDEAVQVIPPEEYEAFVSTKQKAERLEQELAEVRAELEALRAREQELRDLIARLQAELEEANKSAGDRQKAERLERELQEAMRQLSATRARESELEGAARKSQQTEDQLAQVQARERRLEGEVSQLREQLERVEEERAAGPPVTFEVIGDGQPETPPEEAEGFEVAPEEEAPLAEDAEQAPAESWEPVDEGAGDGADAQQVGLEGTDEETPTFQPSGGPIRAPAPSRRAAVADDAIAKIEAEISKIEEELALLAAQERELMKKGGRGGAKAETGRSRPAAKRPRRAKK